MGGDGETVAREIQARRPAALRRANEVRVGRAEAKAALRRGELRAGEVLDAVPECLAGASLSELLPAVPGVGEARLRALLLGLGLSPARELGELTARQRRAPAAALGRRG